ncbi:MAG: thiolase family protein [Armatimonadota bacterium]
MGVGMSAFRTRRDDQDFMGLLQEASTSALADAGLDMGDIEAVVLAQAPDALHGIGHPEQTATGALAARGKPMLRVNTGGATGASAAQVGWWGVASGRFDAVLVVGAEKMGDNVRGAQEVLNKIWDPAYEAALPLNTIAMSALAAVRYMNRYGVTEEQFAGIASRLRANGVRNEKAHLRTAISVDDVLHSPILCWPIRLAMSCPRSTGACAVIIACEDRARRLGTPRAWVRGVAARANTYFMGDKMGDAGPNDHATHYELRLASEEAYRMARIRQPSDEIDIVEPYVPFATLEPAVLESLLLCGPGQAARLAEGGHWDLAGRLPVSPSGGVLCSNAISITALMCVAEAAQQVRGRAQDHQVDGVRTAVATGAGGSLQFFVAFVLGTDETVEAA